MDLLQYRAPLPGGSGQWTSCNTLPHCLGAVGSGPPSVHCLTAWEEEEEEEEERLPWSHVR